MSSGTLYDMEIVSQGGGAAGVERLLSKSSRQ